MALTRSPDTPRRGEVWIVDFGLPVGHEQGYRRPALVISDDRLNRSRAGLVIVLPITTTRSGLPSHIELEPGASGLAEISYAKGEAIKSVSMRRLARRLGAVPADRLASAERSVGLLLGL